MTAYIARRLPKQPGPAAWNRLLPDPAPPRPLDRDATADIAIIGAGFAGLSAARRLGQLAPGLRVAVLEAGRVADGPAGRNSGFMIDLPHDLASDSYAGEALEADRAQTRLNRRAIAFAAQAAEELALDAEAFDPSGKINAAASEAGDRHNRDYAAHLERMQEPCRLLDAAEMQALTGTRFYSSGLFTPGAAMIQPAAYIRGLAGGVSRHAALHEQSPVTRIAPDGAGWRLDAPGGTLRADRVILANNGHAGSFGFFPRRLLHIFTYASMTEPLPEGALPGAPRWGVTPSDPMGCTVRRIVSGGESRIVVRSRFTCDPGMEVSEAAIVRAGRAHDRKFADRFPMLAGVRMQYRWAGHLCLSWNGAPGFGELAPGVIAAVCQNGLGTTRGTLAGLAAAELAAGAEPDLAPALSAQPAPSRLPPEPFARLGANAWLRWKEWRAGRE